MSKYLRRSFRPNEGGAVLVEGAIVVLLVFMLLFLIFQSAFYARTYLTARDAAGQGARAGSIAATSDTADYEILRAIDKAVSAQSRSAVTEIIVFDATSTYQKPAECNPGPSSGKCNVYTGSDLGRSVTEFGPGGVFAKDDFWLGSSRSTSRSAGITKLGVQVTMNVGGIPGPFASSVSRTSVVLLEPHS